MRLTSYILLVGVVMAASPALAGNVVVADGKLSWQSTQCTAPEAPAPFTSKANSRAAANLVNKRWMAYNEYAKKAQDYMDCLSQEAAADAKIASDSITNAAQQKIDDTRKQVSSFAPTEPPTAK
jgi:hypothetical protein